VNWKKFLKTFPRLRLDRSIYDYIANAEYVPLDLTQFQSPWVIKSNSSPSQWRESDAKAQFKSDMARISLLKPIPKQSYSFKRNLKPSSIHAEYLKKLETKYLDCNGNLKEENLEDIAAENFDKKAEPSVNEKSEDCQGSSKDRNTSRAENISTSSRFINGVPVYKNVQTNQKKAERTIKSAQDEHLNEIRSFTNFIKEKIKEEDQSETFNDMNL
jgi:hypothetical protein